MRGKLDGGPGRPALRTALLGALETGEREPTASVLIRMADFYGVAIDYLVGRTEERSWPWTEAVGSRSPRSYRT